MPLTKAEVNALAHCFPFAEQRGVPHESFSAHQPAMNRPACR